MKKIAHLFAHSLVHDNLAWYLTQQLISIENGKLVQSYQRVLVDQLAPQAMDVVLGLGLKPWMVFAPIAKDWAKYNESDNRGELVQAKL